MVHSRVRILPDTFPSLELAQPSVPYGARALGEIFATVPGPSQLPPLEHPQLRQALGAGIHAWENLAQETQPELFASDLHSLALSYEGTENQGIAEAAYGWLSQSESVPTELQTRAAGRLAVLSGQGPWPEQAERFLDHFVEEVTAPELIVGMGVGSLGYGLGRVLGLQGSRAVGLGSRFGGILSRGTGLGLEVSAFTTASLGIAHLRNPAQVAFGEIFFQHWKSALLMVGVLRGSHWGSRALLGPMPAGATLSQQIFHGGARQGATYLGLVGSAYGHQYLGWSGPESFSQVAATALAQLFTFHAAGRLSREIFGRHLGPIEQDLHRQAARLESPNAFRLPGLALAGATVGEGALPNHVFNMSGENGDGSPPPRGRSRTPTLPFITQGGERGADPRQVLGILDIMRRISDPQYKFFDQLVQGDVTFKVEGAITRGSSLTNLLSTLNTLSVRPNPQVSSVPLGRRVVLEWDQTVENPAGQRIEFIYGERGFEMPPATEGVMDSVPEPATSRRQADSHLSLPRFGPESMEHSASDMIQLIRHIMSNKTNFQEWLLQRNLAIRLDSSFGWKIESMLQVLNGLPRLAEIPELQRINLSIGPEKTSAVIMKLNGFYVDPMRPKEIYRPRRTPETLPRADEVGPLPSHVRPPTPRPPRPDSDAPEVRPQEITGTRSVAWGADHLPQILHGLERLNLHLRLMPQADVTGQRPSLVVEGRTVTLKELNEATQDRLEGSEEGRQWDLWVPQNESVERMFHGQVRGGELMWRIGDSSRWDRIAGQALFNQPIVRSPLEIYLLLEAYTRDPGRSPLTETEIQHRGWFTPEYLTALDSLVGGTLTRMNIVGRRLSLVTESNRLLLEYQNRQSQWVQRFRMQLEEGEVESPVAGEVADPVRGSEPAPTLPGSAPPVLGPHGPANRPAFFISRIPTDLLGQMRQFLNPELSMDRMEILLRFQKPILSQDLQRYMDRLNDMPSGRTLVLYDTQGRQTFRFFKHQDRVVHESEAWKTPVSPTSLFAHSPMHLLQGVAMIQGNPPSSQNTLLVTARGTWEPGTLPAELLDGLGSFRTLPFNRVEIFWPASATRKFLVRSPSRDWVEE